jgi:hypothetical protein
MLRAPTNAASTPELYVKADDRWEQNDIASLQEAVVAELLATLQNPGDSGVAESDSGS